MRWQVILNPQAGVLRRHHARDGLAARLAAALGAPVQVTDGPGHAERLAAAATDYDGLVAVGGDGTAAEVANGMDRSRQVLALLAAGTGNGLARDLGLPLAGRDLAPPLAATAAALSGGEARWMDLIEVRFEGPARAATRLALSTTGLGYVAEVVALAGGRLARLGEHLPAALVYPLGATVQALRQRSFDVMWGSDAAPCTPRRVTNVMVQNTRYAGNFRAFPRADLADGLMEVLLADASPPAQLRHNAAVLTRRYGYATAEALPARCACLQSSSPLRLMLDGELYPGVQRVTWTLRPRALRLAVGPAGRPGG